jgi:Ca2+-transporting ATPase
MIEGLDTKAVHRLQAKYGKNILTAVNPNPWWKMLFRQFTDLMVIILMVSALIAIAFGIYEGEGHGLIDGLVIFTIVLVNAAIGFFQEFKAEKALEALQKMIAPTTVVIRNGQKQQIKAENVVPGDIVVLAAGDKIPADGVMIEANEIKVDEAALTGESVPVHKQVKEELSMGTTVVAGAGKMKVISIGMKTRFGRIAHLTTTTVKDESPLQKELFHIGVFVTKVTLGISTILILTGIFIQGQSFIDSLLFAVSVAVAAVPEGLPATITVALALGVQKMVKKNAVVKRLSSIETLGSTTVICSDKTGTLTQNEMTVTKLLLGVDQLLDVKGTGYNPQSGKISKDQILNAKQRSTQQLLSSVRAGSNTKFQKENLQKLREIAHFCSEAVLEKKGSRYRIIGDPTEGALMTLAQKKLEGVKSVKIPTQKILQEVPFDSERKLMSMVMKVKGGSKEILTKGAPDELIKKCTKILIDGKVKTLTAAQKKQILAHNKELAEQALRVIGFAYRVLPSSYKVGMIGKKLEKDLVYVGLAGMIDPARAAVPKAVALCHKAGIRTIIITGDNGLTAKAIAKDIGIANGDTPIYSGEEVDQMTDKQLDDVLKIPNSNISNAKQDPKIKQQNSKHIQQQSLIFSRVNPEHKRRIVDRLKRMGEIVAVTGDGVNDAPALKRADLGIAMGITGTEVSKETANMILLDDSFASIVTAVREGRKIYTNLKKFTWFIFSCNIGELVTVFSAIIFQIPAPLTAALILAIDLGTDILPGIALGVDHAEPDVMDKPPRDQKLRIMNKNFVMHFLILGLAIGAIVVGIYWWQLTQSGWSFGDSLSAQDPIQKKASSLAFTALVVIQLFNAFNARSFEHSVFKLRSLWQLWASIAVSMVLVLVILYVPFFQAIFRTTGLNISEWGIVFGAGILVLFLEESRKLVFRVMRMNPR